MSHNDLPRPDRLQRASISAEAPASAFVAGLAYHVALRHAFSTASSRDTLRGSVRSLVDVAPSVLRAYAPTLLETNPLSTVPGAVVRSHVYTHAFDDDQLGNHYADVMVVVDADVPTGEGGGFTREVSATRYRIDPNPALMPDPASGEPPRNIVRTQVTWTHPNNMDDAGAEELVRDALFELDRWHSPEETDAMTSLGTAVEAAEIMSILGGNA